MSGTPPPNYNPNTSLLQGGDSAQIIPVQGGGSLMTATGSYNPNASLLSGGETAPIIPVQGGGQPTPTNSESKSSDSENNNNTGSLTLSENSNVEANESSANFSNGTANNNTTISSITNNNSGEEEEEEKEGEEEEESENFVSSVTPDEVEEPEEDETKPSQKQVPCPETDADTLGDLPERFVASEAAADSKRRETIQLQGAEFVLRKPKPKQVGGDEEDIDEIYEDWTQGRFTEDEAKFLNFLGLTPRLLYSTFTCLDRAWDKELAEFLYYLTVLTCYPTRNVMTKSQCQSVREFLMLVESNLKAEQLREQAKKAIPLTEPIVLSDIKEIEDEEEETPSGKPGNTNNADDILGRLKHLDVVEEKEKKGFLKKIKGFLSKLKFPSLFKQMKEDQEEGNFPLNFNEGNEATTREESGEGGEGKTGEPEEPARDYAKELRELQIKKVLESLPPQYQDESFRQYLDRKLREEGFTEEGLFK